MYQRRESSWDLMVRLHAVIGASSPCQAAVLPHRGPSRCCCHRHEPCQPHHLGKAPDCPSLPTAASFPTDGQAFFEFMDTSTAGHPGMRMHMSAAGPRIFT